MRWCPSILLAVVAVACSGGDDPPRSGADLTRVDGSPAVTASDDVGVVEPPPTTEVEEPAATVAVQVRAGSLQAEFSGTIAESEDPFGRFVSCSGVRSTFGTYSVLASDPGTSVRSVGITSVETVDAPGVFEATIRVEPATGAAVDAVGTMTIDEGFRTGTFTGFDADGGRLEGDFACDGPVDPVPVTVGEADDALGVVEVFALLRSGGAERLVGLVATADVPIECVGLTGAEPDDDVIVRVGRSPLVGAIDEFVLRTGTSPSVRLGAGATTYDIEDVVLTDDDSGAAGTFTGTADGVSVDGAYRCS